MKGIDVIGSLA